MYKTILNEIPDGVIAFDREDIITFTNQAAAQLLGFESDQAIGKRFLEISRQVEIGDLLGAVKNEGQSKEIEVKVFFPAEKVVLAMAVPLTEGQNMVVLRDITEMKKLENVRREFVANVSHELKTPLTAIRSYAETLQAGAINDGQHNRGFLEKISKNADCLSALIDDILEISSLESGRVETSPEQLNLEEIVDKASEAVSAKAKAKNITIIKKSGQPGCLVKGDPDHLVRAVINLLDNGINYSDPGSKVEVSCELAGETLRLNICDEGVGISAEYLPRIFERFYRVDKARSRDQGGTGLGLAIVKHIMGIHGGSVDVASEVGKGSTFTLIFPVK